MMKETRSSLRQYFYFVAAINIWGIFEALYSLGFVEDQFTYGVNIFLALISLIFAVLFIYFGKKTELLLDTAPKKLSNFVIIAGAINGFLYLLSGSLIALILIVLLTWYLVHNIKKLSK